MFNRIYWYLKTQLLYLLTKRVKNTIYYTNPEFDPTKPMTISCGHCGYRHQEGDLQFTKRGRNYLREFELPIITDFGRVDGLMSYHGVFHYTCSKNCPNCEVSWKNGYIIKVLRAVVVVLI